MHVFFLVRVVHIFPEKGAHNIEGAWLEQWLNQSYHRMGLEVKNQKNRDTNVATKNLQRVFAWYEIEVSVLEVKNTP
jgi:hypothetical protein